MLNKAVIATFMLSRASEVSSKFSQGRCVSHHLPNRGLAASWQMNWRCKLPVEKVFVASASETKLLDVSLVLPEPQMSTE